MNSNDDSVPEIRAFTEDLMKMVMQGAQLSRSFPLKEDQDYYLSLYPELRPLIDQVKQNCINLTQSILQVNHQASKSIPLPILDHRDPEEISDRYSDIVFATDEKLEFIDNYFDDVRKSGKELMKAQHKVQAVGVGNKTFHLHSTVNVHRPQLKFEPLDNSKSVFVPKLSHKYNAQIPLEKVWCDYDQLIQKGIENSLNVASDSVNGELLHLPHPYGYEIDHLEYLDSQLTARKEIMYKPTSSVPFSWVDQVKDLSLLSEKLEKASVIAVDIEQHGYRSYQGFNCLIQISTRTEDFIVDTLALRNDLQILNRTFTNPKIVKVLHGSDNDIVWLQRDFGVYIVNMFDTGQAARQLSYPKLSLSYLLEKFCGIVVEKKKFQLADWRIRPIPVDMMEYARSDTHYLLYIYDRMHNELLEKSNQQKNLLMVTLNNSQLLCKRVYNKEMFQPTLSSILQKLPSNATPSQKSVLTALYHWRDFVARNEDESVRYVLPNHMMVKISELMPNDPIELFSCCNPQPSPLIKSNATDAIKVIQDAKKLIQPNLKVAMPLQPPSPFKLPSSGSSDSSQPRGKPVPAPKELVEGSSSLSLKISQEELFKKADWFHHDSDGDRRKADLHPSNLTDREAPLSLSTSANFFGTKVTPQQSPKLTEMKKTLQSSFTLGGFSSKVPESMEEIYQFSNANRKRNKEKKKLKEDSIKAGPVSPIKFQDSSPVKSKEKNPQEFMKGIGWLAEDITPLVQKKQSHGSNKGSNRGKGSRGGKSDKGSYDYSKHKSSNYGLHREQTKGKKGKKDKEDLDEVTVPHFGKTSHRVKSKGSQRNNSSFTTGGRGGRGNNKPKRNKN